MLNYFLFVLCLFDTVNSLLRWSLKRNVQVVMEKLLLFERKIVYNTGMKLIKEKLPLQKILMKCYWFSKKI